MFVGPAILSLVAFPLVIFPSIVALLPQSCAYTRHESDEISSKSKDKIVELFEEMKDIATQEKNDELTFIHLENAVVLNDSSGNLLYPNYWRLRIDSVDGYMIGASEKYA